MRLNPAVTRFVGLKLYDHITYFIFWFHAKKKKAKKKKAKKKKQKKKKKKLICRSESQFTRKPTNYDLFKNSKNQLIETYLRFERRNYKN
ncbi:hypothetical protein Hanom_Chr13g01234091 [Helianthus anomalus]